jgi:hypothetical protein
MAEKFATPQTLPRTHFDDVLDEVVNAPYNPVLVHDDPSMVESLIDDEPEPANEDNSEQNRRRSQHKTRLQVAIQKVLEAIEGNEVVLCTRNIVFVEARLYGINRLRLATCPRLIIRMPKVVIELQSLERIRLKVCVFCAPAGRNVYTSVQWLYDSMCT